MSPDIPRLLGICSHLSCDKDHGQTAEASVEIVLNEASTIQSLTEPGKLIIERGTQGRCLSSMNSGDNGVRKCPRHGCVDIRVSGGIYDPEKQTGVIFFEPNPVVDLNL